MNLDATDPRCILEVSPCRVPSESTLDRSMPADQESPRPAVLGEHHDVGLQLEPRKRLKITRGFNRTDERTRGFRCNSLYYNDLSRSIPSFRGRFERAVRLVRSYLGGYSAQSLHAIKSIVMTDLGLNWGSVTMRFLLTPESARVIPLD